MNEIEKLFTETSVKDLLRNHDISKDIEQKKISKDDTIENKIASVLLDVVHEMFKITEFKERELTEISKLSENRYLKPRLKIRLQNKKHLKRKHAKELLDTIKDIASMISLRTSEQNETTAFQRLMNRNGF